MSQLPEVAREGWSWKERLQRAEFSLIERTDGIRKQRGEKISENAGCDIMIALMGSSLTGDLGGAGGSLDAPGVLLSVAVNLGLT